MRGFVDLGDNTIVSLLAIDLIDFNTKNTEVRVYFTSGRSTIYTGEQATRLISAVKDTISENWAKAKQ